MSPADDSVPFSSHIEELRWRLLWVALFFVAAFSAAFAWGADPLVRYIQELAVITREVDGKAVTVPIKLTVINPLETFSTTMTVSFYIALAATYPWAMFQLWRFVAPGLYSHERRFVLFLFPAVFVLFFAGAAFGRYVLLAFSIPFLLGFNVENLQVQPAYTLQAFLGLVFAMTFGLGFVFQLPLLVAPLIRFNIVAPDFFAKKRRYTIMIAIVLGAVISPTGSPIDMFIAAAPVFFLVEGGVLLGRWWRKLALRRAQRLAQEAQARGEPVDLESLAGGLAVDLESKLKEFSSGGARKLAREFMGGVRETERAMKEETAAVPSADEVRSLFDDDHADSARPVSGVRLKKPPPRGKKAEPASSSDSAQPPSPVVSETPASVAPAAQPDRPWVEGVSEDLARYIDDRISCRLDDAVENRIRPLLRQSLDEWGEKFKQQWRDNGKDNGHA